MERLRPPRARSLAPLLLGALAGVWASGGGALAGDDVVLRFRDGRLMAGRVREIRSEGVLHESERGTMLWPWQDLTPFCRYEVRASVLAEDDADGRLALARTCLEEGLPAEARREIQRARGLGAGDPEDLDALLARCDRDEATAAFDEADRHVAAGDLAAALAALKSYLVRAPASEWTERARERAADLVRRQELDAERRRVDEERRRADAARDARSRAIARAMADADARRADASRVALIALREEPGGSFTRFVGAVTEAGRKYLDARREYERARRSAGNDRPAEARGALEARRGVEARLLDLYVRLARAQVGQRNWKEAQAALDRALALDPVHPEALELQDTVNKNWVRRKASEITNAAGTATDGTGR